MCMQDVCLCMHMFEQYGHHASRACSEKRRDKTFRGRGSLSARDLQDLFFGIPHGVLSSLRGPGIRSECGMRCGRRCGSVAVQSCHGQGDWLHHLRNRLRPTKLATPSHPQVFPCSLAHQARPNLIFILWAMVLGVRSRARRRPWARELCWLSGAWTLVTPWLPGCILPPPPFPMLFQMSVCSWTFKSSPWRCSATS